TLKYRPDHRQLALSTHTTYLLGIECQVVTQYPCCFFNRDLSHDRHIVQNCGNVIEQCEQACTSHGVSPTKNKALILNVSAAKVNKVVHTLGSIALHGYSLASG